MTAPSGDLTEAQEDDLRIAEDAIARLTDPEKASPAQAVWAISQILATARVALRPYNSVLVGAHGDAGHVWVSGHLFDTEIALNNAAEHAAGHPIPARAQREGDAPPRFIGTSEVARRFGVRQTTISNWVRRYPHTHPALPTPAPHAYNLRNGVPTPLWIDGDWAAWDAWKQAKDAVSAEWLERFAIKEPGEKADAA